MFSSRPENVNKEEKTETSTHCFIELNINSKSCKEYLRDNDTDRTYLQEDFLQTLFQSPFEDWLFRGRDTRESYFIFHTTLPAKLVDTLPPEGVFRYGRSELSFVLDRFTARTSIELGISVDTLHRLCDGIYSNWGGVRFTNAQAVNLAKKTLQESYIATHVDIRNEETKEWERVEQLKPAKKSSCSIL